MELYTVSTFSELSYFKAMTVCSICGYINTAIQVCNDKVNKENVKILRNRLLEIKNKR